MSLIYNNLAKNFQDIFIINDKTYKQIISHVIAFVPLILDAIFQNYSIICPYEKTRIYSVFMLLSPFISVMLVALTLGAQFFGQFYFQYGFKMVF